MKIKCMNCKRAVRIKKDGSYFCDNCGAWEDAEDIEYMRKKKEDKIARILAKGYVPF